MSKEEPIKCQCGLWFATEKDFQEHIKKHDYGFKATKREPKPVHIDFHRHGRSRRR